MKKISAIIKPFKLDDVREALSSKGIDMLYQILESMVSFKSIKKEIIGGYVAKLLHL